MMHRVGTTSLRKTRFRFLGSSTDAFLSSSARQYSAEHDGYLRRTRQPSSDREEYGRINKFAERVIDGMSEGPKRPGWKHTRTLRGDEKRLLASIPNTEHHIRAPSVEKTRYYGEDLIDAFEEDFVTSEVVYEPGTFVEARRNEMSTHGVVLGEEWAQQRWRVVLLTSSGEIWKPIKEDVMFSFPALAPTDLAARCGTSEIATTSKEVHARVEVLKRIRDVEKTLDVAYNTLGRTFHDLYPKAKSSNPDKWAKITVADAARLLTPRPNPISTFAVHKHLMSRSNQFVADDSYQLTNIFHVRPQSHVDQINAVTAMCRLRDGPIDSFISKAHNLMVENRIRAAETYAEPPTEKPTDKSIWTSDDTMILGFLLQSLNRMRSTQKDPYTLGRSAILKKLVPTAETVDDSVLHQALIDLEVFAPWQDLVVLRRELALDLEPDATSITVAEHNRLVQKSLSSRAKSNLTGPLGPEDFYPVDPLHSVRHDFGDLEVYVIDDVGAEELDDGVSIEAIPSEPENFWVHVHIADPAAILPPGHVLAQEASIRTESMYFIHRTWPMLPGSLMTEMSLGRKSLAGLPENVLTFSSKIDQDGVIIDYKVRAGLIRNIRILKYEAIDHAMGHPPIQRQYPFGGQPEPFIPLPEVMDKKQLDDLRSLHLVSKRLVTWRVKQNTFSMFSNFTNISLTPKPLDSQPIDLNNPKLFRGFPSLQYGVFSSDTEDVGARSMVAEMMKVACRVASRFLTDKGIPGLRRSSGRVVTRTEEDFAELLAMRSEHGYLPFLDGVRYETINVSGEYGTEPKPHWGLGLAHGEGYTRVTSPLRRYVDLVMHWQIHHALLGSPPVFSADWLDEFAKKTVLDQRHRKRASMTHDKFWSMYYVKRWMELRSAGKIDGPDPLQDLMGVTISPGVVNLKTRNRQCQVHIPQLAIQGLLMNLNDWDMENISIGSVLPIRIQNIKLGVKPMLTLTRR